MTIPFVTQVRSRPGVIRLGTGAEPLITLRVQVPEVWDTVRVDAPADISVQALKEATLTTLMPDVQRVDDFVMKFRGWEVLDESVSLSAAGAKSGSIFLLTSRRRHPVR